MEKLEDEEKQKVWNNKKQMMIYEVLSEGGPAAQSEIRPMTGKRYG